MRAELVHDHPRRDHPAERSTTRATAGSRGRAGHRGQVGPRAAKYGGKPLRKLLEPGIEVARKGFAVDQTFVTRRRRTSTTSTTCRRPPRSTWTRTARRVTSAARCRTRTCAKTYEYIGRYGADAFYRGPLAKAIATPAQTPPIAPDANHMWRQGLITERDIAAYRAIERQPTQGQLQGPRRLGHGPAVQRRLHRRRGAEHPRGLPAARRATARRCCTASSRRPGTRSPIAASTWATPRSSTVPAATACSRSQFAAARRALITDRAVNAAVAGRRLRPAADGPADAEKVRRPRT